MSDSHKPDRIDEAARIKRANGWITEEKYENCKSWCSSKLNQFY